MVTCCKWSLSNVYVVVSFVVSEHVFRGGDPCLCVEGREIGGNMS